MPQHDAPSAAPSRSTFQAASVVGDGTISVGNQTVPLSANNIIQPAIAVTKTCPTVTSGPAGTVLQYPVTVSNPGNIALTLTATESRTGTFSPALIGTTLAAGATYTGTFSYTVVAGETNANNSLTVTGAYSQGTASGSVSGTSTITCPFTVTTPAVAIFKTADSGSVSAGDPIGFTITIKNTGTAPTSTPVTFTDQLPSGTGISWSESPDSASCTIRRRTAHLFQYHAGCQQQCARRSGRIQRPRDECDDQRELREPITIRRRLSSPSQWVGERLGHRQLPEPHHHEDRRQQHRQRR